MIDLQKQEASTAAAPPNEQDTWEQINLTKNPPVVTDDRIGDLVETWCTNHSRPAQIVSEEEKRGTE